MHFEELPQDIYLELIQHLDYLSIPQFCQVNRRIANLTLTVFKFKIDQKRQQVNELFINYPSISKTFLIHNSKIQLPFPLVGSRLQRRRWDYRYKENNDVNYLVTSFRPFFDQYNLISLSVKKITKKELSFAILAPMEETIVLYSGGWAFDNFDYALFLDLKK